MMTLMTAIVLFPPALAFTVLLVEIIEGYKVIFYKQ